MARTALTVAKVDLDGVVQNLSAANVDGHSIQLGGQPGWLIVNNGSGAGITVTIQAPGKVAGADVTDPTASVGAGAVALIKIPVESVFAQTGGSVWVDFSSVTSVTCQAYQIAS